MGIRVASSDRELGSHRGERAQRLSHALAPVLGPGLTGFAGPLEVAPRFHVEPTNAGSKRVGNVKHAAPLGVCMTGPECHQPARVGALDKEQRPTQRIVSRDLGFSQSNSAGLAPNRLVYARPDFLTPRSSFRVGFSPSILGSCGRWHHRAVTEDDWRAGEREKFERAKSELLRAVDELNPDVIWCAFSVLEECTALVRLRARGAPFNDLDRVEPPPHAELVTRALDLAASLIVESHLIVLRQGPPSVVMGEDAERPVEDVARSIEWLSAAATHDEYGRPARHAGRVELIRLLLGAATIERSGPPEIASVMRCDLRGLAQIAAFAAGDLWIHGRPLPCDDAKTAWSKPIRGLLRLRQLPELADRLTDRELCTAVARLSRRRRSGEEDRWHFLARLVKKAGLGTVGGEALRQEVTASAIRRPKEP